MNWQGRYYKGYMRVLREAKREEAAERSANTAHDRTRAHQLNKCDCEVSS